MAIGEIILHVGMHKTGTTSIQKTFDGYDDGKIAYADLKIPRNHKPNHGIAIETIFRSDFENIPQHKGDGRSKHVIAGFRQQFREKFDRQLAIDLERLIISGEAIHRLSKPDLITLHDVVTAAADRVTVLAYIREPLGYSASMFQQSCRSSKFGKRGKIPIPRYRQKFEKFVEVFGRENVQFIFFDRATLKNGSSVDDFAERVGATQISAVQHENVGLSDDATRCLYMLGMHPAVDFDRLDNRMALSRLIKPLQKGMLGSPFRLPPGAVAAQMNPKDLAWMEKISGFDLGSPLAKETINIDSYLHQLSDEGVLQLRNMLDGLGRAASKEATVEEMLLALFLSYRKGLRLRAILKRLRDGASAFVGKLLPH